MLTYLKICFMIPNCGSYGKISRITASGRILRARHEISWDHSNITFCCTQDIILFLTKVLHMQKYHISQGFDYFYLVNLVDYQATSLAKGLTDTDTITFSLILLAAIWALRGVGRRRFTPSRPNHNRAGKLLGVKHKKLENGRKIL